MIYYITSNHDKVRVANKYLIPLGIELEGKALDLVEIQSGPIEDITLRKADQAYDILKQPLFVNDAGWNFLALNGFPGAYMKYINEWLTTQDFMNLMKDHDDKRVVYIEYFCYKDETQTKLFKQQIEGQFLVSPQGKGPASWSLISLRKDKKSIAEAWDLGIDPVDDYSVWQEIVDWYKLIKKSA